MTATDQTGKQVTSAEIEAAADRILERFIFSKPERTGFNNKEARLPLTAFGEIDATGMWPDAIAGGYLCLNPDTDPVLPDTLWPVDISIAHETEMAPGCVGITRIATAGRSELRGRSKIVPPYCLRVKRAVIDPSGDYWTVLFYAGLIAGKWTQLDIGMERVVGHSSAGARMVANHQNAHLIRYADDTCKHLMSLALTRRYEWTVSLRLDDSPTVLFPTDPAGVRELFKLRELDDGKTRRTALSHWVSSHWRKRRKDPDAVSFVRKHIRGATSFKWAGFDCVVKPSAFDIEKLAA